MRMVAVSALVALPFGRGRNLKIAYPGWPEVPALSSGGWVEEGLLRVRCYAVGDAPCQNSPIRRGW